MKFYPLHQTKKLKLCIYSDIVGNVSIFDIPNLVFEDIFDMKECVVNCIVWVVKES